MVATVSAVSSADAPVTTSSSSAASNCSAVNNDLGNVEDMKQVCLSFVIVA